jgi:radical SAM protein with 4Fe4S-binding SPASM domain
VPSLPEFAEYLASKRGTIYRCDFCDSDKFSINNVIPNVAAEFRAHPTLYEQTTPQFHTFLAVSCNNCGNTLLFHKRNFDDWMAARLKPQGGRS